MTPETILIGKLLIGIIALPALCLMTVYFYIKARFLEHSLNKAEAGWVEALEGWQESDKRCQIAMEALEKGKEDAWPDCGCCQNIVARSNEALSRIKNL